VPGRESGFRHLFSPLRLGPVTLPSRVVLPAHLTNYAEDGLPTARHAAYYAARAAGGAGLVITEEHTVAPGDRAYERLIRGWDDAVLPGYRALTAAVHAHGVPVLAQLNHNGGQGSGLHGRAPVVAPSPLPDPLFREVPVALDPAGIAAVVAAFADVAARCAAGGFDGVELQASQSSLLRAFLSPATNRRTDAWGGPPANRARLLLDVVRAVREALGSGRVLGVRLAGDEHVPGGTTTADAVATARLLAATGAVGYLSTTVGVATATLHRVVPPMTTPHGYALPVARAIRAAGLPVIGVGRITTPEQAERALADGDCDLVGVVRGQLADPEFVAKARAGRAGEIRTCLGCNQECVGGVGLGRPLRCVQNPAAGREAVAVAGPVRRPRRVLVVGGGPAGLRAAAAAARRGCAVTLVEREHRLGGALAIAGSAPGRDGLLDLVRTAAAECARAGVQVRTGTAADAALVAAERPDAVVLATGARPQRPVWAGGSARVVDVRAVLAGTVRPTGAVLVVDELGGAAAPSVAELLAARGCDVELQTSGLAVAQDLGVTLELPRWQVRAAGLGIRPAPERLVERVEDGDRPLVHLLEHLTGRRLTRAVDWVVVATHPAPEDALWRALRNGGPPVHRIGDCRAPRRSDAAVRDAERVAALL
jgi:2,4-dienoyl-CoA reductase (NADPH2)